MHHIIGQAYYFSEDLPRAIESLETALELRDDPNIRASLGRALRDSRTAEGYDRQRLSHFIVSYQGETMEDAGRMAIDTLERSYSSLVRDFGFEPSEPVVVLLYTQTSYREMGGPHWSAGGYDGKIRIPVKGISWGDSLIRDTLHHELAHAFLDSYAGRNVPRWLHEGLAQYVEGIRLRTVSRTLAPQVNAGRNLSACLVAQACDVEVFYAASVSFVDYLVQLRSMGAVRDLLEGLARGDDIDTSVKRAFGRDRRSLFEDWEDFLKRRV
jgi:hypothetical protein